MASKSAQQEQEKGEVIEELLETVDKTLDRVKVLYEQFFLGMQKQPPTQLHTDIERKLRDLQQMQIRNTALRYRFATVQQKFGSYNTYWRRTLRQIENGTYHRTLAKLSRQAALTGEEIPDEILAAMPKRMREQVMRDREVALARAKRREQTVQEDELANEHTRPTKTRDGAHIVDEDDGDFDLDAYFRAVTNEDTSSDTAFVSETATPTVTARAAFETEQPTDADAIDPPTNKPAPVSAAVRAAVGMRVATPPVGVPTAPRTAPTTVNPPPRPPDVTQPLPTRASQPAVAPPTRASQPAVPPLATQPIPRPPAPPLATQPMPRTPVPQAPSQVARPLPVMPGAASQRGPVPVESMNGPFPRAPQGEPPRPPVPTPRTGTPPPPPGARTQPIPAVPPTSPRTQQIPTTMKPPARVATQPGVGTPARQGPPPGMTEADVNALYAKYVKAKEAVGEKAGPGSYGKLLQTINAQAPKIMEQYKAKGVDFQVVVKDNQVVIRAKPKP